MPDLPRTERLISRGARARVVLSDRPQWFRACMARTLAEIDQGEDLATAVWTAVDPVKTAAEIEALAGLRRLAPSRKDSHV